MKIIPQQVGHKGSFCNNRVFNKAIRQPNSFKGNTDTRFYPHLLIYPEKIKNGFFSCLENGNHSYAGKVNSNVKCPSRNYLHDKLIDAWIYHFH